MITTVHSSEDRFCVTYVSDARWILHSYASTLLKHKRPYLRKTSGYQTSTLKLAWYGLDLLFFTLHERADTNITGDPLTKS